MSGIAGFTVPAFAVYPPRQTELRMVSDFMQRFANTSLWISDGLESNADRKLAINLASTPGLEFSGGALKVKIVGAPLALGASGLSVTTGITSSSIAIGNDPRFMTTMEPSHGQRIFRSILGNSASAFTMVSGTAYFVYVGRTVRAVTPKYVEFHVTSAGDGAQTAEVGLYSTPSAPNKAAQSLSKLVATATVDDLTTTGMKRNTTEFSTLIAAGTHVWAAIRVAMATTQPDIVGLANDMEQGHVLAQASSAALA